MINLVQEKKKKKASSSMMSCTVSPPPFYLAPHRHKLLKLIIQTRWNGENVSPCCVIWTEGQKPVFIIITFERLFGAPAAFFYPPTALKMWSWKLDTCSRIWRFPTEHKHFSAAHRNVFFRLACLWAKICFLRFLFPTVRNLFFNCWFFFAPPSILSMMRTSFSTT